MLHSGRCSLTLHMVRLCYTHVLPVAKCFYNVRYLLVNILLLFMISLNSATVNTLVVGGAFTSSFSSTMTVRSFTSFLLTGGKIIFKEVFIIFNFDCLRITVTKICFSILFSAVPIFDNNCAPKRSNLIISTQL